MIIELTKEMNFKDEIANGKVLVDFSATWCGPCQMLKPVLEQYAEESQIKIISVDVDLFGDIAMALRISAVPTLMLFEDGKLLKRESGYMPIAHLRDFINK